MGKYYFLNGSYLSSGKKAGSPHWMWRIHVRDVWYHSCICNITLRGSINEYWVTYYVRHDIDDKNLSIQVLIFMFPFNLCIYMSRNIFDSSRKRISNALGYYPRPSLTVTLESVPVTCYSRIQLIERHESDFCTSGRYYTRAASYVSPK